MATTTATPRLSCDIAMAAIHLQLPEEADQNLPLPSRTTTPAPPPPAPPLTSSPASSHHQAHDPLCSVCSICMEPLGLPPLAPHPALHAEEQDTGNPASMRSDALHGSAATLPPHWQCRAQDDLELGLQPAVSSSSSSTAARSSWHTAGTVGEEDGTGAPHSRTLVVLDCRHCFCSDCLDQYLHAALALHKYPLLCAMPDCNSRLSSATISSTLSSATDLRIFQKLDAEHSFPTQRWMHCPYPTCAVLLDVPVDVSASGQAFTCTSCNHCFCAGCGSTEPLSAPACSACLAKAAAAADLRDDVLVLKVAEEAGWKRCPSCAAVVERIDGCPHMTCRCGASFCYLCGQGVCTCPAPQLGPDPAHSLTPCTYLFGVICFLLMVFIFYLIVSQGKLD